MPDPLYKQKAQAVGVNIEKDTLIMRKNLKDIKVAVKKLTGNNTEEYDFNAYPIKNYMFAKKNKQGESLLNTTYGVTIPKKNIK
tara:strand:+ start:226 stop:477 length:252 start_codon:yes stop_codon:yes gene_type:complete